MDHKPPTMVRAAPLDSHWKFRCHVQIGGANTRSRALNGQRLQCHTPGQLMPDCSIKA